jgi:hypothetical protein
MRGACILLVGFWIGITVPAAHAAREVQLLTEAATQGLSTAIRVNLQAQGNENGLGFSIVFDPAKFTYVTTVAGSNAAAATLSINTNLVSAGKVGVLLGLPVNITFTGQCELTRTTLIPNMAAVGSSAVTFGNSPIFSAVSDAAANEVPATFINNTITVNPLPTLSTVVSNDFFLISWPASAAGFNLQAASNSLSSSIWTNFSGTAFQTNGSNVLLTLPASPQTRLFRLQHP